MFNLLLLLFLQPNRRHTKSFFFIFLLVVQIIFTNKVFLPSSYIFSSNFELYIFVRLVLRTYHSFARLLPHWLREGAGGGVGFPRDSSSFRFSLSLSLFLQRKGESGVRSGNREEKRKHIFLSLSQYSHFSHSYSPCLRYYSLI